jgi:hypothetical protein
MVALKKAMRDLAVGVCVAAVAPIPLRFRSTHKWLTTMLVAAPNAGSPLVQCFLWWVPISSTEDMTNKTRFCLLPVLIFFSIPHLRIHFQTMSARTFSRKPLLLRLLNGFNNLCAYTLLTYR